MLFMDDLDFGLESDAHYASPGYNPVQETQGVDETSLLDEEREKAISLFQKHYFGKYEVEYFPKNTDKKHDYIIAQIKVSEGKEKALLDYMKEVISKLNKQTDELTFIYREKGNFVFANPKLSHSAPAKESAETPIYENSMQFFNVSDITGSYMVEDFQRLPIVKEYMNAGLNLKSAVNLMEAQVMLDPLMVMELVPESAFATADEYDDYLLECFLAAAESVNYNIEELADMSVQAYGYTDYTAATEDLAKTVNNVRYNVNSKVRSAKDAASKHLSPVVQKLKDSVNELIGDTAVKGEVIENSKWMRMRRLFLKLLLTYKSAALIALIPSGLLVTLLIKFPLYIARLYKLYSTSKAIASTASGGAGDGASKEMQNRCVQELELELKITREKIDDAKSAGDKKAKYELMRVENAIEKEIYRIRYGNDPNKFVRGKSVLTD